MIVERGFWNSVVIFQEIRVSHYTYIAMSGGAYVFVTALILVCMMTLLKVNNMRK